MKLLTQNQALQVSKWLGFKPRALGFDMEDADGWLLNIRVEELPEWLDSIAGQKAIKSNREKRFSA